MFQGYHLREGGFEISSLWNKMQSVVCCFVDVLNDEAGQRHAEDGCDMAERTVGLHFPEGLASVLHGGAEVPKRLLFAVDTKELAGREELVSPHRRAHRRSQRVALHLPELRHSHLRRVNAQGGTHGRE